MNFPRSTQYITQSVPIPNSPYGQSLVGMYINNGDPSKSIYNVVEGNGSAYMARSYDDGRGYGIQNYYNMYGNMGSMLSGGRNTYTYYPQEPYRFGFRPVGFPYGLLGGGGVQAGVPALYNYGYPTFGMA